eukprot:3228433-Pyramimonas_sp.AAC.1
MPSSPLHRGSYLPAPLPLARALPAVGCVSGAPVLETTPSTFGEPHCLVRLAVATVTSLRWGKGT